MSIAILVFAIVVASTVLGRWSVPEGSGAAYLGADGAKLSFTSPQDDQASLRGEWARGGIDLLYSGPDPFGMWVGSASFDPHDGRYARWSALIRSGEEAVPTDELYSLATAGVRLEATRLGDTGKIYAGGRLEIPADPVRAGTWDSSGHVREWRRGELGPAVPYTSTGRVLASTAELPQPSCVAIEITETVASATSVVTRTWCPGRGFVSTTAGTVSWEVTSQRHGLAYDATPAEPDWQKVRSMTFESYVISPLPSVLVSVFPVSTPGALAGGTLVFTNKNNDDILAIDPRATSTVDRIVWRARPGGHLLSAATIGQITVAVTSWKQAVAYGPDGAYLWTANLPDTTTIAPLALAGRIAIPTVDGSLTVVDPVSGAVVWRYALPAEQSITPVVVPGGIVVADEAGTVALLSADGQERWRIQGPRVAQIGVAGGRVVTFERGGQGVRGYGLETGEQEWRRFSGFLTSQTVDVGGQLVAVQNGRITAFDPATGEQRWSWLADIDQVVAGPDQLLALAGPDVLLLDQQGRQTARWQHQVPTAGKDVHLVVGADSVSVVTFNDLAQAVLR